MNTGKVVQIIGPAVDVQFEKDLPRINNALEIKLNDKETLVAEVAQQLGDNIVRAVALGPTDGLARGAQAVDTGAPLQVPVGEACLGRLIDVLGQPKDLSPSSTTSSNRITRILTATKSGTNRTIPGNRTSTSIRDSGNRLTI